MTTPVKLYTQHGWGFDASIWNIWKDLLPYNWQLKAAQRGYFGHPYIENIENHDPALKIIITHSLGLHLVSSEMINQADILVIISGFEQFHRLNHPSSIRAIRRMQARLTENPQQVVSNFYKACFDSTEQSFTASNYQPYYDINLLSTDLQLLNERSILLKNLYPAKFILILHGEKDTVTPIAQAHDLHKKLPLSRFFSLNAGHGIPFTHPEWCLNHIQNLVSAVTTFRG